MKVIMFLLDGMRPDALGGIEQVEKIKKEGSWSLNARTVYPSVTLPCHMSLFHSVNPERHGILTNVFVPQVRPIAGLYEVLKRQGKKSGMYYDWGELRDLSKPDTLTESCYFASHADVEQRLVADVTTKSAIEGIKNYGHDFAFIYFGVTDNTGHKYGWMSDEYIEMLSYCWNKVEKIMNEFKDKYSFVVVADHGGHDRSHGSDMDEDMTIPLFIKGEGIAKNKQIENAKIIDVAPTICKMMGVEPDGEWEGKSLL